MALAAADLTGWWIGYTIGIAVVLVVAALLILIIVTVHRIARVAEDATRALAETRDRTEALWQAETTTKLTGELLDGARRAGAELGG